MQLQHSNLAIDAQSLSVASRTRTDIFVSFGRALLLKSKHAARCAKKTRAGSERQRPSGSTTFPQMISFYRLSVMFLHFCAARPRSVLRPRLLLAAASHAICRRSTVQHLYFPALPKALAAAVCGSAGCLLLTLACPLAARVLLKHAALLLHPAPTSISAAAAASASTRLLLATLTLFF